MIMTQYIIVIIIIVATLFYVGLSVAKNLRAKNETSCGGCKGCSVKNEWKAKRNC